MTMVPTLGPLALVAARALVAAQVLVAALGLVAAQGLAHAHQWGGRHVEKIKL